jgi:hypothetical protein
LRWRDMRAIMLACLLSLSAIYLIAPISP